MTAARREPQVVVLGGGSWGTTVASIAARRADTLQWVRSAETAEDINRAAPQHALSGRRDRADAEPEGHHRLPGSRRLRRCCRDGGAVARLPRRFDGSELAPTAMGADHLVGQGARAGHQPADVADRRRGDARPSGRHPRRAEHRPRGRAGIRRGRGDVDAGSAPVEPAGADVPDPAVPRVHHRRRDRRRDGRRVEERLRDRGRHGLFARHRREHPRAGDRPLVAGDDQAWRARWADSPKPSPVWRAWAT